MNEADKDILLVLIYGQLNAQNAVLLETVRRLEGEGSQLFKDYARVTAESQLTLTKLMIRVGLYGEST